MTSATPASEITFLFLSEGIDVNDKSSLAYEAWQSALSTVAKQVGYKSQYYGYQLEDPSILQFVIDWDSVNAHKHFIASPDYGPFRETLRPLLSKAPRLYHFFPEPYPPVVLGLAPCIEMATFFNTKAYFLNSVAKFVKLLEGAEGCYGHAFGEVFEELEEVEGKGKGKAVVLCIGWESKDAHMKFRKTEAFASNVHLLREGMTGVHMKHIMFKKY